ncbi:MAG TPA: hypothetical protein VJB65_02595 [Patescibacteria group bacterium]|nr:hypothetical protein [Patescibacteria group bacterium]
MKPFSIQKLDTNHGSVVLPVFFPDATRGAVKGIDSEDLVQSRTTGLVVNSYHLVYR